jgi:hypothetical protein
MSRQGLQEITNSDVEAVVRELVSHGSRIFRLPAGIKDKRDLFDAARKVLPLDPPVMGHHSWDALADSLWSGLDGVDAGDIAIIWPGSEEMAKGASDDFQTAKSILSDLAQSLADPEATVGNVKHLVVVLA